MGSGQASRDRVDAPTGRRHLGATEYDLGFGLKLANRVAERAVLGEGEHLADAVSGCFSCGTRKSSFFHRSPVIYDMEWAFTLWGFMEGAPEDLIAFRRPFFVGVAEDYYRQREIVGRVRGEAIRCLIRRSRRTSQGGGTGWWSRPPGKAALSLPRVGTQRLRQPGAAPRGWGRRASVAGNGFGFGDFLRLGAGSYSVQDG